jgi:hypothetical protein
VGVPYELPVYFAGVDRCYCGEQIECRAELAPDGAIELTTYECADLLCDGCMPNVEGRCALPPLSEGVYHVRMNGLDVFDLNVSDATPGVGPVDECLTHPRDVAGCGWRWRPRPERTDQVCFPAEAPAGEPIGVAVTDFCLDCGSSVGPCQVTRTADHVHIQPTSLPPACIIDCDMECSLAESECIIPPLEPGTYTVTLEDVPGSAELHVVEGGVPRPGSACLSVPED